MKILAFVLACLGSANGTEATQNLNNEALVKEALNSANSTSYVQTIENVNENFAVTNDKGEKFTISIDGNDHKDEYAFAASSSAEDSSEQPSTTGGGDDGDGKLSGLGDDIKGAAGDTATKPEENQENTKNENELTQNDAPESGNFIGETSVDPINNTLNSSLSGATGAAILLGLAGLLIVAPSVARDQTRGRNLRDKGTAYLVGKSSRKKAKKLSKYMKKACKLYKKLLKDPQNTRLSNKFIKLYDGKIKPLYVCCYNASTEEAKSPDYSILELYAKRALNSIKYGNKQYSEMMTTKNYKKLMKMIELYAKAQLSGNDRATRLMDEAQNLSESIDFKISNAYYGRNIIKVGRNTYPIYPQRYVLPTFTETEHNSIIKKLFDELYKINPCLENKTYTAEISYESEGIVKRQNFSFDNYDIYEYLKTAFLGLVELDATEVKIVETVSTPKKVTSKTTTLSGDDLNALRRESFSKTFANGGTADQLNHIANKPIFEKVEVTKHEEAEYPATPETNETDKIIDPPFVKEPPIRIKDDPGRDGM